MTTERLGLLAAVCEVPEDDDAFYDHQLIGLAVQVDGASRGRVLDVLHLPAHDTLLVEVDGRRVQVPFVEALVPEVDLDSESGGNPTSTIRPLRLSALNAPAKAFAETAVPMTMSAPPNLRAALAMSIAAALMISSAPSLFAKTSFSSLTSTAIVRAPQTFAYCRAMCPRPPIPEIKTVLPGPAPESFTAL